MVKDELIEYSHRIVDIFIENNLDINDSLEILINVILNALKVINMPLGDAKELLQSALEAYSDIVNRNK